MLLTTGANLSYRSLSGSVSSFDFCEIVIKRFIRIAGYIKLNHHISARVLRTLDIRFGRCGT
jgi:hypothetical protein